MSDPVGELKHELLAAAARQQAQAPLGADRRRLRKHLAGHRLLLASVTLAITAAVGLIVTSPWTDSPAFLERAEAALTPPAGTVLHVKWELTSTSTNHACTVRHGPSEIWIDQTPPHRYRVLMNTLPPLEQTAADPGALACSSWKGYELGGAFDSGETLRFEPPRTLRVLPGRFSYPLDPVAELRESITAGTAHAEGRTRIDGRDVERIRLDPDPACAFPACPRKPFYWYVDPETFYPVAAEGAGGVGQTDKAFVPLDVAVRYLAYEYLPRTAANLALTDIRAQHPNANVGG
jgi:hypothetical protein